MTILTPTSPETRLSDAHDRALRIKESSKLEAAVREVVQKFRVEGKEALRGTILLSIPLGDMEGDFFSSDINFNIAPHAPDARHSANFERRKPDAIVLRPNDSSVVFRLEGSFTGGDEADVYQLKEMLIQALDGMKSPRVVVNCESAEHICSDGIIPPMYHLHAAVKKAEGKLALSNIPPDLHDLLRLTKLNTILPHYRTEEEALHAIGALQQKRKTGVRK